MTEQQQSSDPAPSAEKYVAPPFRRPTPQFQYAPQHYQQDPRPNGVIIPGDFSQRPRYENRPSYESYYRGGDDWDIYPDQSNFTPFRPVPRRRRGGARGRGRGKPRGGGAVAIHADRCPCFTCVNRSDFRSRPSSPNRGWEDDRERQRQRSSSRQRSASVPRQRSKSLPRYDKRESYDYSQDRYVNRMGDRPERRQTVTVVKNEVEPDKETCQYLGKACKVYKAIRMGKITVIMAHTAKKFEEFSKSTKDGVVFSGTCTEDIIRRFNSLEVSGLKTCYAQVPVKSKVPAESNSLLVLLATGTMSVNRIPGLARKKVDICQAVHTAQEALTGNNDQEIMRYFDKELVELLKVADELIKSVQMTVRKGTKRKLLSYSGLLYVLKVIGDTDDEEERKYMVHDYLYEKADDWKPFDKKSRLEKKNMKDQEKKDAMMQLEKQMAEDNAKREALEKQIAEGKAEKEALEKKLAEEIEGESEVVLDDKKGTEGKDPAVQDFKDSASIAFFERLLKSAVDADTRSRQKPSKKGTDNSDIPSPAAPIQGAVSELATQHIPDNSGAALARCYLTSAAGTYVAAGHLITMAASKEGDPPSNLIVTAYHCHGEFKYFHFRSADKLHRLDVKNLKPVEFKDSKSKDVIMYKGEAVDQLSKDITPTPMGTNALKDPEEDFIVYTYSFDKADIVNGTPKSSIAVVKAKPDGTVDSKAYFGESGSGVIDSTGRWIGLISRCGAKKDGIYDWDTSRIAWYSTDAGWNLTKERGETIAGKTSTCIPKEEKGTSNASPSTLTSELAAYPMVAPTCTCTNPLSFIVRSMGARKPVNIPIYDVFSAPDCDRSMEVIKPIETRSSYGQWAGPITVSVKLFPVLLALLLTLLCPCPCSATDSVKVHMPVGLRVEDHSWNLVAWTCDSKGLQMPKLVCAEGLAYNLHGLWSPPDLPKVRNCTQPDCNAQADLFANLARSRTIHWVDLDGTGDSYRHEYRKHAYVYGLSASEYVRKVSDFINAYEKRLAWYPHQCRYHESSNTNIIESASTVPLKRVGCVDGKDYAYGGNIVSIPFCVDSRYSRPLQGINVNPFFPVGSVGTSESMFDQGTRGVVDIKRPTTVDRFYNTQEIKHLGYYKVTNFSMVIHYTCPPLHLFTYRTNLNGTVEESSWIVGTPIMMHYDNATELSVKPQNSAAYLSKDHTGFAAGRSHVFRPFRNVTYRIGGEGSQCLRVDDLFSYVSKDCSAFYLPLLNITYGIYLAAKTMTFKPVASKGKGLFIYYDFSKGSSVRLTLPRPTDEPIQINSWILIMESRVLKDTWKLYIEPLPVLKEGFERNRPRVNIYSEGSKIGSCSPRIDTDLSVEYACNATVNVQKKFTYVLADDDNAKGDYHDETIQSYAPVIVGDEAADEYPTLYNQYNLKYSKRKRSARPILAEATRYGALQGRDVVVRDPLLYCNQSGLLTHIHPGTYNATGGVDCVYVTKVDPFGYYAVIFAQIPTTWNVSYDEMTKKVSIFISRPSKVRVRTSRSVHVNNSVDVFVNGNAFEFDLRRFLDTDDKVYRAFLYVRVGNDNEYRLIRLDIRDCPRFSVRIIDTVAQFYCIHPVIFTSTVTLMCIGALISLIGMIYCCVRCCRGSKDKNPKVVVVSPGYSYAPLPANEKATASLLNKPDISVKNAFLVLLFCLVAFGGALAGNVQYNSVACDDKECTVSFSLDRFAPVLQNHVTKFSLMPETSNGMPVYKHYEDIILNSGCRYRTTIDYFSFGVFHTTVNRFACCSGMACSGESEFTIWAKEAMCKIWYTYYTNCLRGMWSYGKCFCLDGNNCCSATISAINLDFATGKHLIHVYIDKLGHFVHKRVCFDGECKEFNITNSNGVSFDINGLKYQSSAPVDASCTLASGHYILYDGKIYRYKYSGYRTAKAGAVGDVATRDIHGVPSGASDYYIAKHVEHLQPTDDGFHSSITESGFANFVKSVKNGAITPISDNAPITLTVRNRSEIAITELGVNMANMREVLSAKDMKFKNIRIPPKFTALSIGTDGVPCYTCTANTELVVSIETQYNGLVNYNCDPDVCTSHVLAVDGSGDYNITVALEGHITNLNVTFQVIGEKSVNLTLNAVPPKSYAKLDVKIVNSTGMGQGPNIDLAGFLNFLSSLGGMGFSISFLLCCVAGFALLVFFLNKRSRTRSRVAFGDVEGGSVVCCTYGNCCSRPAKKQMVKVDDEKEDLLVKI